jgi:hypothetical protein
VIEFASVNSLYRCFFGGGMSNNNEPSRPLWNVLAFCAVGLLAHWGALAAAPAEVGHAEKAFLAQYEVIRCLFAEGKLVLKQKSTGKLLVLREGDVLPDGVLRVQHIASKQAILDQTTRGGDAGSSGSDASPLLILIEKREHGEFTVRGVSRNAGAVNPPAPSNLSGSQQGQAVAKQGPISPEEERSLPANQTKSSVGK